MRDALPEFFYIKLGLFIFSNLYYLYLSLHQNVFTLSRYSVNFNDNGEIIIYGRYKGVGH